MQLITLLLSIFLVNLTFANSTMRGWQSAQTLQVKFKKGSREVQYLTKKHAATVMASKKNEAALAVCKRENQCDMARVGTRDPNIEMALPFAPSTMSVMKVHSNGTELLKVSSIYAHGYTEEIVQLYDLDSKGQLTLVWNDVVMALSPMGDKLEKTVQFDVTSGQLSVGQGKSVKKYRWDAIKSKMIAL
jgi:hypothetical protein